MVRRRHPLVGLVVATCLSAGLLTACGETSDGQQTVAADDVTQRDSQDGRSPEAEPEEDEAEEDEQVAAESTATNADLDAYAALAEKSMRQTFGSAFKKLYSKIDIVPVYPTGIGYDSTFRMAVDPAAARKQLNVQVPTLRAQARTVVIPEMERNGFADPTVTFTYRNPDGSVVWTRTFS